MNVESHEYKLYRLSLSSSLVNRQSLYLVTVLKVGLYTQINAVYTVFNSIMAVYKTGTKMIPLVQ